jgi:hypothetical protein
VTNLRRRYPEQIPGFRRGESPEESDNPRSDFFDIVVSAEGADHSLAHELGKALMTHHLESGREYCKTLLPASVAGIGVYLGLLSNAWPDPLRNGPLPYGFWSYAPTVLMAIAGAAFGIGYFPIHHHPVAADARSAVEAVRAAYFRTLRRRALLHVAGSLMLLLALAAAVGVLAGTLHARAGLGRHVTVYLRGGARPAAPAPEQLPSLGARPAAAGDRELARGPACGATSARSWSSTRRGYGRGSTSTTTRTVPC